MSIIAQLLLGWMLVTGQSDHLNPADACSDYLAGPHPGSVWTLGDCVKVWSQFQTSVPDPFRERVPDMDAWESTGLQLREAGSPCMVKATFDPDGAGSTTMRNLATWIFAQELGCDWVTPNWAGKSTNNVNGTTLYCHWTTTLEDATLARQDMAKNGAALKASNRCSVIDWLSYFQFSVPSVPWPESGALKVIEPEARSFKTEILDIQRALHEKGASNQDWDRLVFSVPNSLASQHLITLGSWDKTKRHVTRKVLQEARTNFHRHPRPWYDENPQCGYSEGRLHFAVHIRMGDRRALYGASLKYFELLERVMDTISKIVTERDFEPPLFHIFSETIQRCPSEETGLFEEFPLWPARLDQVPSCLAAEIPDDCPQKLAGPCAPIHSGMFEVANKAIVLHLHPDVQNAMSCMIQAHGVIMGCSTFGQIAGLFTRGISLFSTQCGGINTPVQYKSIPPLAVAEMGYLWVPIAGSWRDPVLTSTDLFRGALTTLLTSRQEVVSNRAGRGLAASYSGL